MAGKNIITKAMLSLNILIIINYYFGIMGADASYSDATATSFDRHLQHQRMALLGRVPIISHSHITTSPTPSSSVPVPRQTNSRVHHVIEYGADPTGLSDSTDALERALSDAFRSSSSSNYNIHYDSHLMRGVTDLGGTQLHLDGGTYKISRPLRLPRVASGSAGNFMVINFYFSL